MINNPPNEAKWNATEYRPVGERTLDFKEVTQTPMVSAVEGEARRCMDCGVPFCHGETGCPLGNLIPEWNALAGRGQWSEALQRLHATNNFPEFTSRLCPAPCEPACVLDLQNSPVHIKSIERQIIDHGWSENLIQPLKPEQKLDTEIAVIGSGPAGLSCAQELARKGYQVTVYEREQAFGGLLRFGIPDFKMEKSLIDRRIEQMRLEGVKFIAGVEIGRHLAFKELRKTFDAIAIAIGSERPRDLLIPGRDLTGIHLAMDYLVTQNKAIVCGGKIPPAFNAAGKRVIILGGGDTGSDCLGTALRQNAQGVSQLEIQLKPPTERSTATPWPYWPLKLRTSHAHEEGGQRHWDLTTLEFKGQNGQLTSLVCRNNQTQETVELQADMVILALGFTGISAAAMNAFDDLAIDARGRIVTNTHFQTSLAAVYAGGDAKRGASLIVWAIAEGRKMAATIDQRIKQRIDGRKI